MKPKTHNHSLTMCRPNRETSATTTRDICEPSVVPHICQLCRERYEAISTLKTRNSIFHSELPNTTTHTYRKFMHVFFFFFACFKQHVSQRVCNFGVLCFCVSVLSRFFIVGVVVGDCVQPDWLRLHSADAFHRFTV